MTRVLWFTAAWCGPCQKMKPIVTRVSEERHDEGLRVAIVDIDSDEGKEMSSRYGVVSVPTFIRIDDAGSEVVRLAGAHPRGKFEKMLGLVP